MLKELLKEKQMTIKECSMASGIPYSTLCDLVHQKTKISNASGKILYKLSKTLNVSMENLILEDIEADRTETWDHFRSELQHQIKRLGDKQFLAWVLQNQSVERYWKNNEQAKSLYMVAAFDYLCRINKLPQYAGFNEYRHYKLEKPIYTSDVVISEKLGMPMKAMAEENSIPEFRQYNIMEGSLRDVF